MTTFTKQELERFSDAAGRHIAETDGCGMPVAARHSARFQELLARRASRATVVSVETQASARFVMPYAAMAMPDR